MPCYMITKHARLEGVGLSKAGHWGGKRYPDPETAEAAAKADAGDKPYTIDRETKR